MSDEREGAGVAGSRDEAGEGATPHEQPKERVDEEGLPLDREPTIDDVRGASGSGRTIAIGCSVLVALAIAAFWAIRAGLLG